MTYELMVKSIDGAAAPVAPAPTNPSMNRPAASDFDPGRPWSGDEYDQGPVSDPADAFAHFTMPATTDPTTGESTVDTEAWLDRNDDGTMIGWVRQGGDVWRYSDPEAWGLDVDGAQMQPAGGEAEAAVEVDPAAAPAEGTPAEEAAETPAEEDEEGQDLPPSPDDEEFENPFADPTGEPTEAEAATADNTVLTDDKGVPVDPAADPAPVADPPDPDPKVGAPADQPADAAPVHPSVDNPESENYRGVRDPVRDKPEPVLDETEQDRLFKKRGGTKALLTGIAPGPRRLEHKAHFAGECDGDSGDKEPSPSGDTKPSSPPRPTAKQASLHPDILGKMSDHDLDALAGQGDLYDHDTMLAAAREKDHRSSQDKALRELIGDAPPRSPERVAAFDSIIPHQWSEWAATKSKYNRAQTQQQQIESGYHDYLMHLMHMVETDPNVVNGFWKAEYRANPPFDPILFFTGNRRASLAKYASDEFKEWMGTHRPMTLTQWLAEFYPSAAKAARNLDSGFITEWG